MFKKYRLLNKKSVFCLLFFSLVFGLLLISRTLFQPVYTDRVPSNIFLNPYVIPAGTQLVIPPWIMQRYQLSAQKELYGDVFNYLMYNYGVSAPNESGEDTYYIPLNVSGYDYDDDYDSGSYSSRENTYMVDVAKVKHSSVSESSQQEETGEPSPQPVDPETPEEGATVVPSQPVDPETPGVTAKPRLRPGVTAKPRLRPDGSPQTKEVSPEVSRKKKKSGDTFTAEKDIDIRNSPLLPRQQKPELDLSKNYPLSCNKSDIKTEAKSPCLTCTGYSENTVKHFLTTLERKVTASHSSKSFPPVIDTICKSCYGVDAKDFFNYIEKRAKEEGIPSEILFAFVMRESNGDCNVGGDGGDSVGMFQLNTNNSTCLRGCKRNVLLKAKVEEMKSVCKGGTYRNEYSRLGRKRCNQYPPADSKICLNNPYCNFEEAFHLLKDEKWPAGNNQEKYSKSTAENWTAMSREERHKWRNAIVAYNGRGFVAPTERAMKKFNMSDRIDDWEQKRIFFVRSYLYYKSKYKACAPRDRKCKNRYDPKKVITNLAHVESITGREVPGGFADSAICQWIQFVKKKPKLSCR